MKKNITALLCKNITLVCAALVMTNCYNNIKRNNSKNFYPPDIIINEKYAKLDFSELYINLIIPTEKRIACTNTDAIRKLCSKEKINPSTAVIQWIVPAIHNKLKEKYRNLDTLQKLDKDTLVFIRIDSLNFSSYYTIPKNLPTSMRYSLMIDRFIVDVNEIMECDDLILDNYKQGRSLHSRQESQMGFHGMTRILLSGSFKFLLWDHQEMDYVLIGYVTNSYPYIISVKKKTFENLGENLASRMVKTLDKR